MPPIAIGVRWRIGSVCLLVLAVAQWRMATIPVAESALLGGILSSQHIAIVDSCNSLYHFGVSIDP